MINDQAIYWAVGFLVIYILAQLLVSYHPFFASFSQIKKSITVKGIALLGFVAAYVALRLWVG